MDVHATSTVWCLLDGTGAVVARGRVATTTAGLAALLRELGGGADLVAGHEVGTMAYFVHDTLTAAGVRCLAFNAQHLRMIAASRKKTDRRDAYWIAKALQSGMYPPPVYIPTGEVRELRVLLHRRRQLQVEYGRWRARARAALRAAGSPAPRQAVGLRAALAQGMAAAAAVCRSWARPWRSASGRWRACGWSSSAWSRRCGDGPRRSRWCNACARCPRSGCSWR